MRHAEAVSPASPAAADLDSADLPLTERGLEQARETGRWIERAYPAGLDGYVCSEFVRARQTARHLGLAADWLLETHLVEGGRGTIDLGVGSPDLVRRYGGPEGWWGWLPGVERRVDVAVRAELALRRIGEIWPDGRVLVVTHAAIIWRLRMRIEAWSMSRYSAETSRPGSALSFCDMIQYRRSGGSRVYESWRHLRFDQLGPPEGNAWNRVMLGFVGSTEL